MLARRVRRVGIGPACDRKMIHKNQTAVTSLTLIYTLTFKMRELRVKCRQIENKSDGVNSANWVRIVHIFNHLLGTEGQFRALRSREVTEIALKSPLYATNLHLQEERKNITPASCHGTSIAFDASLPEGSSSILPYRW